MRPRLCGVLLHISSLPSPYGIGDLGPSAHNFARTLAACGLTRWQFLPLAPTSFFIGNSPYSSPSAFAGNPLFISLELLLEEGIISHSDVESALYSTPDHSLGNDASHVDYAAVQAHRETLFRTAFEKQYPLLHDNAGYNAFCLTENAWLEDYALFMSIKEEQGGASWTHWPEGLKRRRPESLADWRATHGRDIELHKFVQYLFFSQWFKLHALCAGLGVRLIGDLPIYVTHDSVDVWANRHLFHLDNEGNPITVAGVPPDYFSVTGQRWGNPIYNWQRMREDGFAWWNKRLAHNLRLTDSVRLDHFRGFAGYWEIPAHEQTAIKGAWREALGQELFASFYKNFGVLPLIAEDLGVITPDVCELMSTFNLPGMKVLQFAFGEEASQSPHIPFRHRPEHVVYTGTHDNPTSREWFSNAEGAEKNSLQAYLGHEVHAENAHETLVRMALASPAELTIIPMQDILGLGQEGRMNTPSTSSGNWTWRLRNEEAEIEKFIWIRDMCKLYGRA